MAAAYEGIKWFRVYYQMYCLAYAGSHHPGTVTLNGVPTTRSVEEALIQKSATSQSSVLTTNNRNVGTLSNDQVYVPTVVSPPDTSNKSNLNLQYVLHFRMFMFNI